MIRNSLSDLREKMIHETQEYLNRHLRGQQPNWPTTSHPRKEASSLSTEDSHAKDDVYRHGIAVGSLNAKGTAS